MKTAALTLKQVTHFGNGIAYLVTEMGWDQPMVDEDDNRIEVGDALTPATLRFLLDCSEEMAMDGETFAVSITY